MAIGFYRKKLHMIRERCSNILHSDSEDEQVYQRTGVLRIIFSIAILGVCTDKIEKHERDYDIKQFNRIAKICMAALDQAEIEFNEMKGPIVEPDKERRVR